MKKKGARIEELRSEHFNTEIRFDKSRGIFSVEMPVGEEPIVGTELEKVRSAARVKLREWRPAGEWKRKIFVALESNQVNHKDRDPWRYRSNHRGRVISYESQSLGLGFCVFDQLEPPPNGKIIIRAINDNGPGEDGEWAIRPDSGDERGSFVLEWTKEREAALVEIQKGLGKLTERLRELVATPELIGRAMRELSSGGKR